MMEQASVNLMEQTIKCGLFEWKLTLMQMISGKLLKTYMSFLFCLTIQLWLK
jgi:hypothetical protein